jgi:hypothetical protein
MAPGRRIISLTNFLWLILGLSLGVLVGRSFQPAGQHQEPPRPADVAASKSGRPEPANERQQLNALRPAAPPANLALERLRKLAAEQSGSEAGVCLGLIGELSAIDCPQALRLFRQWPTPERQLMQRAIARRWASLDPEAALREIAGTRDRDVRSILASEAARELVRRDPDAALARLSQPGPLPGIFLTRFIIGALADKDPGRAAAYLLTQPIRDDDVFATVAARWAESDSAAAVAWATSVPMGQARTAALNAAWSVWGEKDPATVATAIINAPETRFDASILRSVAGAWSKDEPRAAIAWIERLTRQVDRDNAWAGFSLDARTLGAEASIQLLKEIGSDNRRAQVAAQMARDWARDNAQAALAWAQQLPEGAVRNGALRPVLEEWAAINPSQVVAYLTANPTVDPKSDLLPGAAGLWATRDSAEALQWLQSLPSGLARDEIVNQMARGLREVVEPAKATQLLGFIESPLQRQELVREIAGRWAASDAPTAAQWLGQLPDAASQIQGHHSIARQWAFTDREATARWMETLPSGAARDAAIDAFVQSVDGYDPALATAWASAMGNASERDKAIRSAFGRWLERDVPSARDWLQQVQLNDSLRSDLLQAAERQLRDAK